VEQVFRWAHAADPGALLFYNDAEGETLNAKSDAIYAMVKDFKRRGVPIDGVGLQMHLFDVHPDIASIAANIARFTSLGVQVHITEMDVSLPTAPMEKLSKQTWRGKARSTAASRAHACPHPGCTAIQTWGFTDKYSWIRSKTKGTKGAALPFDRNYVAKPACLALKRALSSTKPQK
jgi:endo-1,4-beta-xylanase